MTNFVALAATAYLVFILSAVAVQLVKWAQEFAAWFSRIPYRRALKFITVAAWLVYLYAFN